MKYLSLFSGIGGFELGIQRAWDKSGGKQPTTKRQHSKESELHTQGIISPLCIGYSEIDKYAIKVYERQFNGDNRPDLRNGVEEIQNNSTNSTERKDRVTSGHKNYGDATKIDPTDLPDFDLLVGGFPCQAFSIAGKRRGFDDTRGTLFFDIARILAEKRPRHLVLENVKGLLSHDSGKTFQTILGVLSDLGYRVEWQVLNSKDFGVPQNRERVYIIGHLGNGCGRKVFPLRQSNKAPTEHSRQGTGLFSGSLDSNYHKGHDGKRTLIAEPRIRRLTPVECERLQGFPDNWTKEGKNNKRIHVGAKVYTNAEYPEIMSDSQRYKMCGNAVTVNVVEAVVAQLFAARAEGHHPTNTN